MSTPTKKIKLGPLPKLVLTKVTFACTTVLLAELQAYAELHGRTYGESEPVDVSALIPHMLQAFMAQDQAFKRAQREEPPDPAKHPTTTSPRPSAHVR